MRRIFALLTLTLLTFLGAGALSTFADGDDNEIGACLAQDQVWLLVVTQDGEALANQCVGDPANGEQALADGGMQIQFGKNRLICTLSGHPATCPATFDGSYWSYYQGAPGQDYTYSELGAQVSQPEGGTIEAWCFATAEAKECTPPQLVIVQAGQQITPPQGGTAVDLPVTHNEPVSVPSGTPWALILTGVGVVVVIVGLVVWQRSRRAGGPRTAGGR